MQNLRPLMLQNMSWLVSVLLVQLWDFFDALTPMQQRGFIQGRSIFTNLWHTFGPRSMPRNALFCPMDFKKDYDFVSHDCISVFLGLMHVPLDIVALCLLYFTFHGTNLCSCEGPRLSTTPDTAFV